MPKNRNLKILEIGPGFGELLSFLSEDHGYKKICAIDISQEVVDFCNNIIPRSTEITDDTIGFLEKNKNQYGMIFMLHVLEHIQKKDTIPLLSQIYTSLQNGGTLIVEVPNMANPIVGLNLRYADFTHESGFTDISLKQVLRKAGFTNVSVFPCKVPIVSVPRFFQSILQQSINQFLNLISNAYLPRREQIMSSSIYAVATKS